MDPHLQFKKCACVCVSVCAGETAQPDSAGRQAALLTADEMECLLTQGASATHAPLHRCSLVHLV